MGIVTPPMSISICTFVLHGTMFNPVTGSTDVLDAEPRTVETMFAGTKLMFVLVLMTALMLGAVPPGSLSV